jgi:hypothetical protein
MQRTLRVQRIGTRIKKETVTSRRQSLVEMIGEIIQLEGDGDNRFVGQDQLPCGIAQQQLGS